jgi:hypothetical protein
MSFNFNHTCPQIDKQLTQVENELQTVFKIF